MTISRIHAVGVCVLFGIALIVLASLVPALRPAYQLMVALGGLLGGFGLGVMRGMEWGQEQHRAFLRQIDPLIRDLDRALLGPRCRGCGCTDLEGCPEGCWWVEPDLCSSCVERVGAR